MKNMNKEINILQLIKEGYRFSFISKLMSGESPENLLPEKETLLNLFQNKQSFKLIGETLGVNEKVVKNWFKQHNLPTTLKEMKKITSTKI